MTRRPLNGLEPRTAEDAARDPYDWADEPVRSAILGGAFPGLRRRRRRTPPRVLPTDHSLPARLRRTARALWRWLCSASPWGAAR